MADKVVEGGNGHQAAVVCKAGRRVQEGCHKVPAEGEGGRRGHQGEEHSTSQGAGVAGSNQAGEAELRRVHMVGSLVRGAWGGGKVEPRLGGVQSAALDEAPAQGVPVREAPVQEAPVRGAFVRGAVVLSEGVGVAEGADGTPAGTGDFLGVPRMAGWQ